MYLDDPRDLSAAPTLEDFLHRYRQFIRNCARALQPGGKLAILMGDYTDKDAGFVPLTYHTKRLCFEAGLKQHCTDIVRFSHDASSSHKVYKSVFIPGLHDICSIFEHRLTINTGASPMTNDNYFIGKSGQRYRYADIAKLVYEKAPETLGKHISVQLAAIGLLEEMEGGVTPCGLPFTFASGPR